MRESVTMTSDEHGRAETARRWRWPVIAILYACLVVGGCVLLSGAGVVLLSTPGSAATVGTVEAVLQPPDQPESELEQPEGELAPTAVADDDESTQQNVTVIDLAGVWKFKVDPNEEGHLQGWQQPDLDDLEWRDLYAPGEWEKQGVTGDNPTWPGTQPDDAYNGYAWYRRHVTVPANWAGAAVALRFGAIDDRDRTYFNGEPVGTTTGDETWRERRDYVIPSGLLKAGGDNVIAVRVCDTGGVGGITEGPLQLVNTSAPWALGAPLPSGGYVEHRGDKINIGGSVDIPAGMRVHGDAVAVGGSTDVRGYVTGDVVAVGGSIHVRSGGRVDGEAVSVGGGVHIDPGGVVHGRVNEVTFLGHDGIGKILRDAGLTDGHRFPFLWGPMLGLSGLGMAAAFLKKLVIWGVFAVIAVLLFPKRLELMAQALPTHPGRSAIYGVAGFVLTPPALVAMALAAAVVMVVLCITVIGILLVPAVGLGLAALYLGLAVVALLGIAAVILGLGNAVAGQFGRADIGAPWAVLIGVLLVALMTMVPVLGALVGVTVWIFGFGVAIMTGLGADPDWAQKRLRLRHGPETPPPPPHPPTPGAPTPPPSPTPGASAATAAGQPLPAADADVGAVAAEPIVEQAPGVPPPEAATGEPPSTETPVPEEPAGDEPGAGGPTAEEEREGPNGRGSAGG
jgi:hypothetical protein